MTPHPFRRPGTWLFRVSASLLDAQAHAAVAQAIADLQHEVREAGPDGRERFAACWRGYCACWRLIMTMPFVLFQQAVPSPSPLGDRIATTLFGASRNRPMVLVFAATTLALWPMLVGFGVTAALAGLACAVGIRLWNDRHPVTVAAREHHYRKFEIGLAPVQIDNDAGGLFFAAGTVAIVLIGLPGLSSLFVACLLGGAALAGLLFAWRQTHPMSLVSRNSLRLR